MIMYITFKIKQQTTNINVYLTLKYYIQCGIIFYYINVMLYYKNITVY